MVLELMVLLTTFDFSLVSEGKLEDYLFWRGGGVLFDAFLADTLINC